RAGARHEAAARAREVNLIFVLPPNVYVGPPGRGTFWFQIFIQAPSPEIWRKTISGGEGGCWRGKWGGLFMGYLLGKNIRRRDRDHLVPPRRMDAAVCRAEVCYPFGRKHGKASGSETAQLHRSPGQRGGRVAARGQRAAGGNAGDRVPQQLGA